MSQKNRKIGKTELNNEKVVFGLNQKQRSRAYTILFFVVVAILFILNNSDDDQVQGPYPPNYKQNQDELLKLSELKGKVVLVDFWATWCVPCREGIPDLVMIKNEFKDKNFEIVGISVDALTNGGATAADVSPFMKAYNINYPIVRGDGNVVNSFGGIQSIPTSFLIDKDGQIIYKHEGLVSKEVYLKQINEIFKNDNGLNKTNIYPEFVLPLIK